LPSSVHSCLFYFLLSFSLSFSYVVFLLDRSLWSVIINTNVPTMLDDLTRRMSMFTPIDFSKMRQTNLGIKLLDNRFYASRLRNVSWQFITFYSLYFNCVLYIFLLYSRFLLQRVSIASYAERCISHDRFCLTVRPSVTRWYHAKTTPARIMQSLLEDSP